MMADRHDTVRLHLSIALHLGLVGAFLLAACSTEPKSGPEDIKWDRQTCERCQMVISERHFAVEWRGEHDRRLHAFDDLGCALLWRAEQRGGGLGDRPEIWVRDAKGTHWLDGYGVRYEAGHRTPMGYGYAAANEESQAGLSLHEVEEQVHLLEKARRGTGG